MTLSSLTMTLRGLTVTHRFSVCVEKVLISRIDFLTAVTQQISRSVTIRAGAVTPVSSNVTEPDTQLTAHTVTRHRPSLYYKQSDI